LPYIGGMKTNAIIKARDLIGGTCAVASIVGVKPPTVTQWINGDRQVPIERCPAIERATNGAVTCEELRPDFDWEYLRTPTKQKAIA
jgi:DNA-binding transcriptional regulator YdaS (Cro superfamily)